jgi:glycosyltransferase involved in cell wall biosynthesis
MNIGTICYATQSGLGHLGKMFIANGVINRLLHVKHSTYETFEEQWYPDRSLRYERHQWAEFLDGLDALLLFETAMNQWGVVAEAKKRGIKIAIIPMYEWTPARMPVEPDVVICPSDIDVDYFKHYRHYRLNIPAPDPKLVPWKERTQALLFVHNAGHGQVGFGKGTPETLEAFTHVKSGAHLLVRAQSREPQLAKVVEKYKDCPNITVILKDVPYHELFAEGDVYINAERYNGLSLPLQEAFSAGLCVMTTDRYPANTWLPKEPLFPVAKYDKQRIGQTVEVATIDPRTIASYVDAWYGRDIRAYSHAGRVWAEENSWERLKPQYLELLSDITGR